jgi:serine/threonine protein kinase/serine/threonine protein phosphatase PrpC
MGSLKLTIGQCSHIGHKAQQQDFCAVRCPDGSALTHKGIAVAVADGISSSQVSHIASQTCVSSLLEDYYSTPDSWNTETSLKKVLLSVNAWLYAQSRNSKHRYEMDKGYVCTLSGLIFKSNSAYLFHVGDTRVYRVCASGLEPLTEDHRYAYSEKGHFLTQAMGMRPSLDLQLSSFDTAVGEVFVLATDGVYEWLSERDIVQKISHFKNDLQAAAQDIVEQALEQGSDDNLTIQIVRVDELPPTMLSELQAKATVLPIPEALEVGQKLDGYTILKVLHQNHRSRVYLVIDPKSHQKFVIKAPTKSMLEQPEGIEQFLVEEWVIRRMNHPVLLTTYELSKPKTQCYLSVEYFDGQTLTQWRTDTMTPSLQAVRPIVEQIAKGLLSMHRQQMQHQDIRPQNVMINQHGQIKIIDYGSTRIEGLTESHTSEHADLLGELQYAAPERLIGWAATEQSDLYSLACLMYYLLSGKLPYGADIVRASSRSAQRKLKYKSLLTLGVSVPNWIDQTIQKAVHIDPNYRYTTLSEFVYDLSHPNPKFTSGGPPPLIEKNPVAFWQMVAAVLLVMVFLLAGTHPLITELSREHTDVSIAITSTTEE